MARDLTAAVIAALGATLKYKATLVKMAFDEGTDRLWTGVGDLVFPAAFSGEAIDETYVGVGAFLGVSEVRETDALEAVSVRIVLNGLNPVLLPKLLTADTTGRPVTVWEGFFDADWEMLGAAKVFSGRMDVPEIKDRGDSVTAAVSCESDLLVLERPNVRRWTHEDQQLAFPGDRGFEFVNSLQQKELKF